MAGLYITKKKQNKKAISDNWWFAGLSIILLLTALVKRKAVKNGFSRQGNVWRAFLTGKTGKIWLDYPVHGKAGSVLAAVLLAVLLGMLLFVLVKKKRTGMLLVVWTIWMAGYGIGFFGKDGDCLQEHSFLPYILRAVPVWQEIVYEKDSGRTG